MRTCHIGLSKPADPPKPTVKELVNIWAYICFRDNAFFFAMYKICGVLFQWSLRTRLTTKNSQ
jgi:hypothetical protein